MVDEGTTQTTFTFSGLGRTKKVSKANAAQEALDYVTQNMPHLLETPPLPVSRESEKVALEVKGHRPAGISC